LAWLLLLAPIRNRSTTAPHTATTQVINDALRKWKESRVEARRNQVYDARAQLEKQWGGPADGEGGAAPPPPGSDKPGPPR